METMFEGDPAPAGSVGYDPEVRREAIGRALVLEYVTVAWNVFEGLVALAAALLSHSVAMLGFGIDSLVECASALVLVWRLRAERVGRLRADRLDAVERRARRLAGASLILLAAYVVFDAARTLWVADRPSFSALGTALLALSTVVMSGLARRKQALARQLESEAMAADAVQSTACGWLSVAALAGVGLNGLCGWWWADPLGALAIACLLALEGRGAWKGESCCRAGTCR